MLLPPDTRQLACDAAYPASSHSPTEHFGELRIKAIDEGVLAGPRVRAERLRPFDQNLIHVRAEDSDRFVDEGVKRHRLFGFAAVHEVRAHPGRCDFEYANLRVPQHEALREDVRM